MPDYPNPYEFVPLESSGPERRPWDADQDGMGVIRDDRLSGRLTCLLHPETPLYIHGEGQQRQDLRQFFRLSGRPGIPASSLKGALRSTFEIVSNGCLSSLTEEYKAPDSHQRTYRDLSRREFIEQHPVYRTTQRVPRPFQPCTSIEDACPACLLFGMVERDAEREGAPLAGRLFFGDATPIHTRPIRVKIPAAGGGPHPWHRTFYFQEAGAGSIMGRKLYCHHSSYQETLRLYGTGGRGGLVELDAQQGDFTFTIDFLNLTEQELAFLAYALVLEPDIRHHMFYGKPYGLGSLRLEVQRLDISAGPNADPRSRFLQLQAPSPSSVDSQPWANQGLQQWLARPGAQSTYTAFKRILTWPGAGPYKYPSFDWFRNTTGSGQVTLAQYQAGQRVPSAATRPTTPGVRPPASVGSAGAASAPVKTTAATTPAGRHQGVVKKFFVDSGYGFIERPGKPDLFVHVNQVRSKQPLAPGQAVSFLVGPGRKGEQAQDVVPLQEETPK